MSEVTSLLTTLHMITGEVLYDDWCSTVSGGHSGHWIAVLHARRGRGGHL
ncbi:unnamed protein product [Staurois parvus]|uniref:Uncharacterized protein n=1 Tax=Staurois parvus TaxID=386267 RepID=A0ABN9G220_9NEOB|nr:unnamed protein product [Staurois parvus]